MLSFTECLDITEKKLGKLNIMINNALVLDEIQFEKMIAIGLVKLHYNYIEMATLPTISI